MGTVARVPESSGGTPAPEGNHLAVCVGVIDLGTQYSKFYDKWSPKVMIQWELSDELMGDGRPFVISRKFTLSLHENSGLRKILNSWRGVPFTAEEAAGFDVAKVLGKPGMVTVVHEPKEGGGVFANVEAVTPLPKRIAAPQPVNALRHYSMDDGPPPHDMPDWIKKVIGESREAKSSLQAATVAAAVASGPVNDDTYDDSDIPF